MLSCSMPKFALLDALCIASHKSRRMKFCNSPAGRLSYQRPRSYQRLLCILAVLGIHAASRHVASDQNPIQRANHLLLRNLRFQNIRGSNFRSSQKPLLILRGGSPESLQNDATADLMQIVPALMSIDNTARSDAESRYAVLKKDSPEIAAKGLLQLLSTSTEEDKRAFAAVLASRTFPDLWPRLQIKTKQAIKYQLLLQLETENVPNIARKVANIIAALAPDCHEGSWPELLPKMFALSSSQETAKRELGLHTLALLPQHLYTEMKKEVHQLKNIYSSALGDSDSTVQMAGMRATVAYLQSCDSTKEMRSMQPLLPLMLNSIGAALQQDETVARSGLEALIDVTDLNTKFFKPQLPQIVTAMQQHVALNENLDASTRELGLEILVALSERAPSMMKKLDGFVAQIVAVCMALMVQGLPASTDCETWASWNGTEDEDDDEETEGCYAAARAGLDRLAMSLGSPMVPVCFQYIPDFIGKADDWRYRMVGLLTISQTGEGSRKEMKKHLSQVLELVLPRVMDEHPRVRWAAINCIGQMCSDFGPGMQKEHHATLLPALINRCDANVEASFRVRSHAAAALINFCEDADATMIEPHLQTMLAHLANLMQTPNRKAREQAVTTVATIAVTVGNKFEPFYGSFMPFLKTLLASLSAPEDRRLRGKVLECISLVGVSVGRDRFQLDARETMDLLVRTQQEPLEADDPQVPFMHTACGRICRCLGAEFVPYLPAILPALLRSASLKADVDLDEEEITDKDWNDIMTRDVGEHTVGVRTSTLDEKQTACDMLVTYVNELRGAFFPFLESAAQTMLPLLTYNVHEDIRSCAADAMPALCRCAAAHVKESGADPAIVQQALDYLYPAVRTALQSEQDGTVQGHLARAIGQMVDACRPAQVASVELQETTAALKLLLDEAGERVEAIVEREEEEDDSGEGEAEDERRAAQDEEDLDAEEELIEQIAYAIGKLILTQGEAFLQHADTLLPWFLEKLSPAAPVRLQRLSMAMIDDVIEYAGPLCSRYIPSLLPLMMTHSLSPDIELRQAALFGIGLCAEHGGASFRPYLSEVLLRLETAMQEPDARSEDKESATDNAAASLGKVAFHHGEALTEADRRRAWASWLAYMPLRADVGEAALVHKQLCRLVHANHLDVLGANNANLPRVLRVLGDVLETELLDEEGHTEAKRLLQQAQAGLGQAGLESLLVGVPQEALGRISRALEPPPAAVAAAAQA